jgi:hypothetical protein
VKEVGRVFKTTYQDTKEAIKKKISGENGQKKGAEADTAQN